MKNFKNKSGITLVEVIIFIFLFGLFMSLIGYICMEGIRAFKKSRERMTSQQEAQLSVDRLCRELNESYEPGIKVFKTSWNGGIEDWDAICFPTSRDDDDASGNINYSLTDPGKLIWNRYVIYFKKFEDTSVYRRVINASPPPFPTDPLYPEALDDPTFTDFLSVDPPAGCPPSVPAGPGDITDDRKIAREIYNISFNLYNPALIEYSLPIIYIEVESRVYVNDEHYESTIIKTSVKPTNK